MVDSCLQSLPQGLGIGIEWTSDIDEAPSTSRTTEWAAETVLDLRDAPPPSLAAVSPQDNGNSGLDNRMLAFSLGVGACSSRSSSSGSSGLGVLPGLGGQGDSTRQTAEPLVDLEQLLQALIVEEGVLEDERPRTSSRGGNPDADMTPSTLREMRRTGPLGALHQDAQSALLAGPLFEYGDVQASARGSEAGPETDQQQTPPVADPPSDDNRPAAPRLTLDWLLDLGQNVGEAGDADGDAWDRLLNTARSHQAADGSAWDRLLNTARSQQVQASARSQLTAVPGIGSNTFGRTARTASARTSARTVSARTASEHTPVSQRDSARDLGSHLVNGSPRSALSSALSDSDSSQSQHTVMHHLTNEEEDSFSNLEQSVDEAEEEVISVFDVSDEPPSARIAAHARALLGDLARSPGSATPASVDGAGNGMWSSLSSTRTNPDRPLTHRDAAESALLDGSLNSMLRRLTVESQLLDESLTRSVRRVLQLGTVLTGQRLSDEEIRALPKVRFESAEQQHCAICLEAYQEGELLTALRCSHYFHVECLARWMRRATLCPLCRTPCGRD